MTITKKALVNICIAAAAVLAIILMFAPYVSMSNGGYSETISGFEVTFTKDGLGFTIFPLLVFLFLIAIAVLACLNIFIKDDKLNKLFNIIIVVLAAISAICLFLAGIHGFMWKYGTDYASDIYDASVAAGVSYGPGVGAIINAILMICACCGATASIVFIKD